MINKKTFLMVSLLVASSAAAQERPPAGEPNPRREMLEQRLRERTAEIVQRRLELSDEQMRKLQATNRQFEEQRTSLIMRERSMRRELRAQMMLEKADQNRVAQLLDQTIQLERQRLDLLQNEQRELAKFLSPVQRAKLFGLQNEMRRRAQEMRNGRPMQGRNPGPGRPRRFD